MTKKNYNLISAAIAVIALTPLLLVVNQELWDAVIAEMGFLRQDTFFITDYYNTQWIKYHIWLALNQLYLAAGLHPRLILNLVSVLSILGLAREVFLFLRANYGFSENICYIGSWCILSFPIWHILISSLMFMNILCLYLFMLAVNTWRKNKPLAVLIFLPSLQLYSIFALAVGFVVSEFVLTVKKDTFIKKAAQVFLLSLALVGIYLLLTASIDIHNGSYNTFTLKRIQSIINFGAMSGIVLAIVFFMRRSMDDNEKNTFLRKVLSFLALSFFAGLAYWAVGRPLRFFAFGSFTARHCLLTAVPFALLVAIIAEQLASRLSKKTLIAITGTLILSLLVLIHQGHSHKIAALVFKEALTQSLKQIEEPPSGYVALHAVDYQPPRHTHAFEINMCLYKAYGKSAWMTNGYFQRGKTWDRESLVALYDMPQVTRKHLLADEVTGDAFTHYRFHLDGYHQEGRFWYWWYFLTSDYSAFKPRLELVEQYQ